MAEINNEEVIKPSENSLPIKATQHLLAKACKRIRSSSNGTKAVLVDRLAKAGVTTREEIEVLAHKWDIEGQVQDDESTTISARVRQAQWTPNEVVRLAHVLEDPRNFIAFRKLHQQRDTRADIEERHDPWSVEFVESFNSRDYVPERPDICDGVTQQMLDAYDPNDHPHERSAEALRSKWATLRARYTICERNFEKSGQGESDVFPDFAKGNPVMSYIHCLFKESPALEMVIREIGVGRRAESEIGGSSTSDRTEQLEKKEPQSSPKKRKGMTDEGLEKVAESLAKPVEVKITFARDESEDENGQDSRRSKLISNDILGSLMDLEKDIVRRYQEARNNGDEDLYVLLHNRLTRVQARIEAALDDE